MIIPNQDIRPFVFMNADGKKSEARVIAFDIDDKGSVKAITWPAIPKGAQAYVYENGYRHLDIATGIVSGPATIQPEV
jgi:hypothetical protein